MAYMPLSSHPAESLSQVMRFRVRHEADQELHEFSFLGVVIATERSAFGPGVALEVADGVQRVIREGLTGAGSTPPTVYLHGCYAIFPPAWSVKAEVQEPTLDQAVLSQLSPSMQREHVLRQVADSRLRSVLEDIFEDLRIEAEEDGYNRCEQQMAEY